MVALLPEAGAAHFGSLIGDRVSLAGRPLRAWGLGRERAAVLKTDYFHWVVWAGMPAAGVKQAAIHRIHNNL